MVLSSVFHPKYALAALLLAALPAVAQPDQLTPVLVSALTNTTQPFPGTDGKYHVDYELVITNSKPTTATLTKIEVLDAAKPSAVIASYEGGSLLPRLRTLVNTPAKSAEIEFNGTRMFLIDLTFETRAKVPSRLEHRVSVMAAPTPAPVPITPSAMTYTVAPIDLRMQVVTIGPPLRGNGWVSLNGCCGLEGAHRGSGQSVNGGMYFAQRFAIDWMRMDEAGRLVHGDPADVHSYTDYDADVIAVAAGTVVAVLDDLQDQIPGKLPDVSTITLANVDGNHVVLDLGGGVYAFYAHMRTNSIVVKVGQRVTLGQVLGKLGNTGNTSAPHLHFHLMDGISVLGSNGIPYVIDSFALAGKISGEQFAASENLEGSWNSGLFPSSRPEHDVYPLDLDVVNFPNAPAR